MSTIIVGYSKSDNFDKNYDRIFRKKPVIQRIQRIIDKINHWVDSLIIKLFLK